MVFVLSSLKEQSNISEIISVIDINNICYYLIGFKERKLF